MVNNFIEGRHVVFGPIFCLKLPRPVVLRVLPAPIELVDLLLSLRFYLQT